MNRLFVNTTERSLPAGPDADGDAVAPVLARLRALLDVDTATLSQAGPSGLRLLAASGGSQHHAALRHWQARALETAHPLIVADTCAAGDPPGGLRFFAGIVLAGADESAPLLLSLGDTRPRSAATAHRLAALAIEVTSAATISRLGRELEAQKTRLAQRNLLFERASQTARIGVWICDLSDESLEWSDSVYDLFELPRGSALSRGATADRYTPQSRRDMEAARARAIADGTSFSVDAEIITAKGARRWMRLTGSVETENGVARRIFGMKQDITEEKLLADRTRYLAETDVMTGLANRSQFQNRLFDLTAGAEASPTRALLLVDLDDFKQINDNLGHAQGDQCLKEAAQRLTACCPQTALVARIGGDEFAVLLDASQRPADVAALAETIVAAVGAPFTCDGQDIKLSASVGVAYQDDGTADDLFARADMALYAAKAAGRSTSRTYAY